VAGEIEKPRNGPIVGEQTQYVLAFGVIAVMLYVIGLPAFVIFILGAFSFFLWKLFNSGSASETRRIFEFYLSASEILRSDDRRWYGFEIQDAVARGEKIVGSMQTPPPLVYFTLGCLQHKRGAHALGVKYLEQVLEDDRTTESAIVFPSNDLREYVRVLRKIERDPASAPQTSSAIRLLERLRRTKGQSILDEARRLVHEIKAPKLDGTTGTTTAGLLAVDGEGENGDRADFPQLATEKDSSRDVKRRSRRESVTFEKQEPDETIRTFTDRKPISELLRDIYDENTSSQ
jgi:hypothetical protein